MAHLFRPVVVKPVPKHATTGTVNGRRVARWTARGGRPVTAELTADGKKCRVKSPTWWVQYTDATGRRVKVAGFRDRAATEHLASRLQRRAEAVRAGQELPDEPAGPEHLADHLEAYREYLVNRGVSARHPVETIPLLRGILDGAGLTTPAAVDAERLAGWLARERTRREWSARTYSIRVARLKAFGSWLVATKRARWNPFAALARLNPESDRRRVRRVLTADLLAKLVATTAGSGETVKGMAPADRANLYLLAAYTGFRASTLARLTPESIEWDGKVPAVVYSGHTKNGEPHGVPLHPDAAKRLASWLRSRPAGEPLFGAWQDWHRRAAGMLRVDLAAAGIPYRDAAGRVFDFHALRVQFASSLAKAGVPLTAAQDLLDHSDPRLTANVYTRWGRKELAGEVAKLPGLGAAKAGRAAAKGPNRLGRGLGQAVPNREARSGKRAAGEKRTPGKSRVSGGR